MKLLTKAITEGFDRQGNTDGKPDSEKKVIAKFFHPLGSATWYAIEYNKEWKKFLAYVTGLGYDELGNVSLTELENTIVLGLGVERDKDWDSNTTLEQVKTGEVR
tara:strand:- start:1125 stop:1439 length:315 start_codon:yes stop_codon:yes gene_type:complete